MKKKKVLLLQDVESLGRQGDIVTVRAGHERNYLSPNKLSIMATERTIELQEALQKERLKKAEEDKKEAQKMADRFTEFSLEIKVKTDHEGNLYGSVTHLDVLEKLREKGFALEKQNVVLPKAIKRLGSHPIIIKLKEGVTANFNLEVSAEESITA